VDLSFRFGSAMFVLIAALDLRRNESNRGNRFDSNLRLQPIPPFPLDSHLFQRPLLHLWKGNMADTNLVCPICQERFSSEEDRLAHERSAHQVNPTGPSVENANTTVVDERDRNTRRSA
jgi:hypothetical protein